MTHTEPTLDGMPEIPPAWVRPDEGVRLGAQAFDRMMQAALPHVGTDEDVPVLMSIHVSVLDGLLTTAATDRYSLIRERRPVSQTCEGFGFLLRSDDASSLRVLLKSLLRGLKDEARDAEPIDLAIESTDDGPTLRILGRDLDVRFTEHVGEFPRYEALLDGILAAFTGKYALFDVALNPTLLARVVPCQRAGRVNSGFSFTCAPGIKRRSKPVVVQTTNDEDDVVIVLMPLNPAAPGGTS